MHNWPRTLKKKAHCSTLPLWQAVGQVLMTQNWSLECFSIMGVLRTSSGTVDFSKPLHFCGAQWPHLYTRHKNYERNQIFRNEKWGKASPRTQRDSEHQKSTLYPYHTHKICPSLQKEKEKDWAYHLLRYPDWKYSGHKHEHGRTPSPCPEITWANPLSTTNPPC